MNKINELLINKIIFFDLDGTLSEYRFNNHISGKNGWGGQTFEELLFGNVFSINRPLKTMQNIIQKLNSKNIYVLGTITTNHEIEEKYKWLEIYFPTIKKKNIIFVSNSSLKLIVIQEYSKKLNIEKEKIVFIDDKHSTLREVEEAGITSYHTTSFME